MSAFALPHVVPTVRVTLPNNLSQADFLAFPAFQDWLRTFRKSLELQTDSLHDFHKEGDRYVLQSIDVHSVQYFGKRVGFLTMETVVQNVAKTHSLPGVVFLRGGSVAILIVLSPIDNPDERFVIMTQQPRVPAGSLKFWEIPAGMLDGEGNFVGAAARELYEETGLTVAQHSLKDLTRLALQDATEVEPHLHKAMYPSPGGCDEYIALFLYEKTVTRRQLDELMEKVAGVDDEKIKVKIVRYEDLWREGARDAKTLGARALYEGIKEYQPELLK